MYSRIRHVKCDERKPQCYQCCSTGRVCDGAIGLRHRDLQQSATPSLIFPKAIAYTSLSPPIAPSATLASMMEDDERLAMTFFRQHTACHLQGSFHEQFWQETVLQISHHEPAALHAVIAVGALHRALSVQKSAWFPRIEDNSAQHLAIHQYTKAVSGLNKRIASIQKQTEFHHQDVLAVLICCLIFVAFEMMQGTQEIALEHLRHGISLLQGITSAPEGDSQFSRNKTTSAVSGVLKAVLSIFVALECDSALLNVQTSLGLQGETIQQSLGWSCGPECSLIPLSFDDAGAAKSCLDVLWHGILNLRNELIDAAKQSTTMANLASASQAQYWCYIQVLSRSVDLGASGLKFLKRKDELENALLCFETALKKLTSHQVSAAFNPAAAIVHIQFILVWFHLATCRSTRELDCDRFNGMFQTAIELAEKFVACAKLSKTKSEFRARPFTLDPSLVPNISLVSIKCRDPHLRFRASIALRDMKSQEGMWDSVSLSTITEQIAKIETRRAVNACLRAGVSKSRVDSCNDIPEQARMLDVNIVGDVEARTMKLLCGRYAHEHNDEIVVEEIDLEM